jgi:predicted Zn finger-like uncharacterized protein
MRLTCPACKAQYEVPSNVIPEDGRDVQCSNCGETWFQENPDLDTPDDAPAATNQQAGPLEKSVEGAKVPPQPSAETSETEATDPDAEPTSAEIGTDTGPVRRKLDPTVADVLREEAELEARARRKELSGSVESQPDLGLTEAFAPASRVATTEMGATSSQDEQASESVPSEPETGIGSAQGDLPDAAEINSTLRASSQVPDDTMQTVPAEGSGRRGFRSGFTLIIALAAVGVIVYAFAPHLAQGTPELDPWLSAYVARVDEARMWLNGHVRDLLDWLDTVAASSSGSE